jgi:hypothetical protein
MTKKEYDAQRYQQRKELVKKQSHSYYMAHRETVIARQIKTNKRQRKARRAYDSAYKNRKYAENPERYCERVSLWRKNNRGKLNHTESHHRAEKLRATPPWLTVHHRQQMQDLYIEARRLQKLDGIKRHIDHIYPLKGKTCCGLHVPWNLRILTAMENLKKGNKLTAWR